MENANELDRKSLSPGSFTLHQTGSIPIYELIVLSAIPVRVMVLRRHHLTVTASKQVYIKVLTPTSSMLN